MEEEGWVQVKHRKHDKQHFVSFYFTNFLETIRKEQLGHIFVCVWIIVFIGWVSMQHFFIRFGFLLLWVIGIV